MKKFSKVITLAALLACVSAAYARDDKLLLSIQDAINAPEATQVLNPKIKVYFAQSSGRVVRAGLVSNRKTNSVGKTDEEACRWAFLSAVKQLQEQAVAHNASKVTNIVSYYKKNSMASTKEYECHAGGVIAGVALKGDLAN
ncbi:excinuclease ABC subunit A [Snodgrassella sp. ESL0324]|uniref:excinuclease ABC subunit A n=1 Tax=Snodgrassella sp. ESL0324 TaxID=2705033 RepID=UPI0015821978|nr:excinuclease ABC subunit A [Snodgrassella sp. ESL0324]NUF09047.1 excinuclease ABC subunit A [Snodgrassella sp. ESL0324]